ncbi:ABC transporter ATP-binding protein [Pelagibacterium montanilacus]|uniref:ABC transporter ATP-binding protein n=1 Tax=Pelagibacterium montanilacus TaxID=2185280 RepID=UPI000F8EAE5E|nr:sn-glycerol-3-phosphate ABC transporter ATP-binding protein UgpC [Pelagibacterium montanilacus]
MGEVAFRDVVKRFDDGTIAVNKLNIEVADGEFLVLVGPSGCGKSTSLRMVAGLEEVSGGTIEIDGEVVNSFTPRDRDIAMVFQSYALYPHMTVEKNMAFPLRMAKVSAAEKDRRVKEAADILDIGNLLNRYPRELSGGQRQRVAMGRAIVRSPRVFLMDEPLSNLDAKLRVQMRGEISHLQRELRTTTLYVTHDQVEAMTLGDRVAVMHNGVLQQLASPEKLYASPGTVFVAGFIGSPPMNLCHGTVEKGEAGLTVRFGSMALGIDEESLARYPSVSGRAGQDIIVGMRPECFSFEAGDGAPGRSIRTSVDLVEMLGAEALVYVRTDARPVNTKDLVDTSSDVGVSEKVRANAMVARVSPKGLPQVGETVELHYETGELHFFDPVSGLALS